MTSLQGGHCVHWKKLIISVFGVRLSTAPFGICLDAAVVSILIFMMIYSNGHGIILEVTTHRQLSGI